MTHHEDWSLPKALIKTIDHFVPEFWRALARVKDPRNPLVIAYPSAMELMVGLLLFLTKLGSRRGVKYKLGTPAFAAKRDFPMLDICLLLDALFACKPVIKLCRRNRWAYIITFKEGGLPAVWQEYQALKGLTPENVRVVEREGCRQTFRWINDIDFDGLT